MAERIDIAAFMKKESDGLIERWHDLIQTIDETTSLEAADQKRALGSIAAKQAETALDMASVARLGANILPYFNGDDPALDPQLYFALPPLDNGIASYRISDAVEQRVIANTFQFAERAAADFPIEVSQQEDPALHAGQTWKVMRERHNPDMTPAVRALIVASLGEQAVERAVQLDLLP